MRNKLPSSFTRALSKSLESWPHMPIGSSQFRLVPGRMDVAKAKIIEATAIDILNTVAQYTPSVIKAGARRVRDLGTSFRPCRIRLRVRPFAGKLEHSITGL